MTVTLDVASNATDLGAYAEELDRTLAGPSERLGGLPAGGSPSVEGEPEEEHEGAEPIDPNALVPLVAIVGGIATTRAQVEPLADSEKEAVAEALGPVLDKYAGDLFEMYAEEVALAAVLYLVAQPRLAEYRDRKRQERAVEVESEEVRAGDDPDDHEEPDLGAL